MPRVSPAVVRSVSREDPLLGLLLPVCRELECARRELRWIRGELGQPRLVRRACQQRARSVPLQYVLGSQPFGALHILCAPRVLIPRWETEEWATELARRWKRCQLGETITVVDLCTGTGCVALTLKQALPLANVTAVDCSRAAVQLAQRNAIHNNRVVMGHVTVLQHNVLQQERQPQCHTDLLVCNPPYIPRNTFVRDTATSVKVWEPRLALVGDKEFYGNLCDVWLPHTQSFVYEIGDLEQAHYVARRLAAKAPAAPTWAVGVRNDAQGNPRVVYGYRTDDRRLHGIFLGFGALLPQIT